MPNELKDLKIRFNLSLIAHKKLKDLCKKYNLSMNKAIGIIVVKALEQENQAI